MATESIYQIKKNDLTQGSIWKKMLVYFLPLAVGTIFQQLYNAVDGFVVGKFVGTIALAAIGGSAALVSTALVNFFVSLTGGGEVLIAQFFGANNDKSLSKAAHTSILFAIICGLGISIIGFILTPNILIWMNTPAETIADATVYLKIVFSGMVFQLIYNMAAGILRAVGNSRDPFINLTVSCLLNIALDFLTVAVLGWGVLGAAVATIFSQFVCAALTVRKLIIAKGAAHQLCISKLAIDANILKRIMSIGGPLGLQSMMYSTTNILIQVGLNGLSTATVAAWALEGRFDGFFWGLMSAANITISNFIGQNFGKGDYARMKKGVKVSFALFMSLAALFSLALYFAVPALVPFFTDDAEVVEITVYVIHLLAPFYCIWPINEIFSGALRGEGCTFIPFIITALSICGFRILWLLTVFKMIPTLHTLAICYPITWIIASLAISVYYNKHIKKRKR